MAKEKTKLEIRRASLKYKNMIEWHFEGRIIVKAVASDKDLDEIDTRLGLNEIKPKK